MRPVEILHTHTHTHIYTYVMRAVHIYICYESSRDLTSSANDFPRVADTYIHTLHTHIHRVVKVKISKAPQTNFHKLQAAAEERKRLSEAGLISTPYKSPWERELEESNQVLEIHTHTQPARSKFSQI